MIKRVKRFRGYFRKKKFYDKKIHNTRQRVKNLLGIRSYGNSGYRGATLKTPYKKLKSNRLMKFIRGNNFL